MQKPIDFIVAGSYVNCQFRLRLNIYHTSKAFLKGTADNWRNTRTKSCQDYNGGVYVRNSIQIEIFA